jgi:G3E family GTPase
LQCASFGDVSPTVIFGTRKGCLSSNRKKNSHSHHDFRDHHDHEDGAEGQHAPHVRSFVYKSSRPFQPQRLVVTLRNLRTQIAANSGKQSFIGEKMSLGRGILRAKGLVWLATDMKRARYSL